MPEFIVRDADGRFLGAGLRWHREYPDALVWDKASTALTAARRSKVLCEVVSDYGLETQRVVETVG